MAMDEIAVHPVQVPWSRRVLNTNQCIGRPAIVLVAAGEWP